MKRKKINRILKKMEQNPQSFKIAGMVPNCQIISPIAAVACCIVEPIAGLSALKSAIATGAVGCIPRDLVIESTKNKQNI